jgi:Fe-S oxidoreductases
MTIDMASPSFLYGPVPSRRLGYSLGVDLLPFKTCSMDCVYCQLGGGARTTVRRRAFIPVETVLAGIENVLQRGDRVDAITFSGSGEPTLHPGLGRLIRAIKRKTAVPVVLLTNGSLFTRPSVRKDAAAADIVVPSLDAATEDAFRKINRPHPGLSAAAIIEGLAAFRRHFHGRLWLEVLFVKGINDRPSDLRALKKPSPGSGPTASISTRSSGLRPSLGPGPSAAGISKKSAPSSEKRRKSSPISKNRGGGPERRISLPGFLISSGDGPRRPKGSPPPWALRRKPSSAPAGDSRKTAASGSSASTAAFFSSREPPPGKK